MSKKSRSSAGFSLIELMVVVVIVMILAGFVGWNYVRYRDRQAVEGSARVLRSFLNDAKDNAKNGRFASDYFVPESNFKLQNYCYVGDLTYEDPNAEANPTACVLNDGQAPFNDYCSWLEMIASNGIVLESWGVFFDQPQYGERNPERLEMHVLCRKRPKYSASKELYSNTGGNYNYPSNMESTLARVDYLERGVKVYKPSTQASDYWETKGAPPGIEFTPLYLSVLTPVTSGGAVDFQDSCFGEADNEIVIGTDDGQYLYKIPVGTGGDVGEGCFCAGPAPDQSGACLDQAEQDTLGDDAPCAQCADNN